MPDERMIRHIENTDKTDRKGTGIMKENRYELNKQLAQMLKGGVIMDVTTPEHVQSWHWKESRQISVRQAAYPA